MTRILILLGGPGAGKGTQAARLSKWLGLPVVSTGELFREAMDHETALGKEARTYIERGALVPDQVTNAMVEERLQRLDCGQGVILDGYPRTVAQAEALDEILSRMGRSVSLVIDIDAPEDVLLERLSGRWVCSRCGSTFHEAHQAARVQGICDRCGGRLVQREDDRPETQRHRIEVYRAQTAPLIDHYSARNQLIVVDGAHGPDEVERRVREAVVAEWGKGF